MIPVAADPFPHVIAHRGGAAEAPENTIAALNHARELGVRQIETDVQLTADGVVVVSHDETVDRRYDGEGAIADLTYEEISELRDEHGERMPRLAEVFQQFPDLYFTVDAKTEQVTDPLVEVVREQDAAERVVLASFSEKRLERVRDLEIPGLTTSLGTSAVVRLMLAAETVSDAEFWRIGGPGRSVRVVQAPEKTRGIRVVNPRFIATAHTAGLAVHAWTVNDPDSMVRLLDWGVDGIVTDEPSLLIEILRARGQWEPDR